MDVKSSWRKALEEDKAEKIRLAVINDSVIGRLTPLDECRNALESPVSPTSSNASVSQQGVSFPKSTLLWDTFNAEALDSPSGTGSSAVQFSLDQETLPEMPSCDSLLSLDDEAVDLKSDDDDELLIPSLKTEARHHLGLIQQPCDDGSFVGSRKRTPERLLSDHMVSALDRDWLMEPAKPAEATDKVFSLELDTLEMPSPPKKQEYSLPKLITFSPIDDMKC